MYQQSCTGYFLILILFNTYGQLLSDMTSVDTTAQWRDDRQTAFVVNYTIITDHTIRQSGFDLPYQSWSLLNRFRTGQDPCHAILHKWGLAESSTCNYGQQQTMSHIVDVDNGQSSMADYNYLTKLKMTQSSGWSL